MRIKASLLLRVLAALGGGVLAGQTKAQTFTVLHTFSDADGGASEPTAGLIASGNTLYGTTAGGGGITDGTVFRVNTDGSGFTLLHSFSGSDGVGPRGQLILLGDTLYGTTRLGGTSYGANNNSGDGTVFAINTNGSGFTTLYSFSGGDGQQPWAGLTAGGDTLYGTTQVGGGQGYGTVFAINPNGSGFTTLHDFSGGSDGGSAYIGLYDGLALSSNTLYGASWGAVFALNTDGTAFTVLDTFTNSEGPSGTLILSENTLYGTTTYGGALGIGSVFALAGNVFTTLHSFSTDSESNPLAGVILSGDTLYGTTEGYAPGSSDRGIVFALNTNGTQFTILHSFTATDNPMVGFPTNSDGLGPRGGLLLTGNTLYGTTYEGGSTGYGTIFSISLPVLLPQLTISPAGANVLLTWPTNAAGFTLQSSSDLSSAANWLDSTATPTVLADHYVVTNRISAAAQFYRLKK